MLWDGLLCFSQLARLLICRASQQAVPSAWTTLCSPLSHPSHLCRLRGHLMLRSPAFLWSCFSSPGLCLWGSELGLCVLCVWPSGNGHELQEEQSCAPSLGCSRQVYQMNTWGGPDATRPWKTAVVLSFWKGPGEGSLICGKQDGRGWGWGGRTRPFWKTSVKMRCTALLSVTAMEPWNKLYVYKRSRGFDLWFKIKAMEQSNRLFLMLKTETKTKSLYKKSVSRRGKQASGAGGFQFHKLSFLWNFRNNDVFW